MKTLEIRTSTDKPTTYHITGSCNNYQLSSSYIDSYLKYLDFDLELLAERLEASLIVTCNSKED